MEESLLSNSGTAGSNETSTSSSVCPWKIRSGGRRFSTEPARVSRTHHPSETELETTDVRSQDVRQARFVVAENHLEVESIVRWPLGQSSAQAAETETGRRRSAR